MLFSNGVLSTALLAIGVGTTVATDGIPAFSPLSCNDIIETNCTDLSNQVVTGSDDLLVIPCGKCSRFDLTDGSTLTIPGGINVEGRLVVDSTANGILNTTAVVVQGELSIREPTPGHSFNLNLFGTDDIHIVPHVENKFECGTDIANTSIALPCNLGKKPIAVMGGKLDVDALPPGKTKCPSWVNLKSKYSSTVPVADDLLPSPTSPAGIAAPRARYTTDSVVVFDMGDDEYKIENAKLSQGLRVRFKPVGSLERTNAVGKTITLSWSYKVDDTAASAAHLGWKGSARVRWGRYSRPKGEMLLPDVCPETVVANEWVTCSTTFIYTATMSAMTWNDFHINFQGENWSSRTGTYIFSFKDIKAENLQDLAAGVHSPDTLEVGVEATACWSVGDDILITPSSHSQNGHVLRSIKTIKDGFITLNESVNGAENSLLAQDEGEDGSNFSVEVGSLSRKVKFTAEEDDVDPLHGGHLIILHTPNVAQTLRGVEIKNFGQQGNIGRYPIHLHVSEDLQGTVIAKNIIRNSNQRCIVVHGSHNATMYDNIAFDVVGHCFMLENGGEWHNTFERNLGCKNSRHLVEEGWTRSDIAEPALFLINNPHNFYIDNVAAGSSAHGFWFELLKTVHSESALLEINQGVNPREMSLIEGGFIGNVAHSCYMDGITSQGNAYQFRTNWRSKRGGPISVFENTKSYKNTKDGVMLNAQFMHIKGGIFADNDRCVNMPGGGGNIIEGITCTAVSKHQRDSGVTCHGQFEKSNPEPGFAGLTFNVNKGDTNAEIFKDIVFTGFDGLESCWGGTGTAIQSLIPNALDNKRWTGPASFQGGLTFDGPSYDIKCGDLDWSAADSNAKKAIQNVYVNDNDGAVGSAAIGNEVSAGSFFATRERDPDATAFIDPSSCTNINYPGSCGMYCEGPCMRRIGIQNDAAREDVLMVISDGDTSYEYERNPNAVYYPRWLPDYEAILPKPSLHSSQKYAVSFIDILTRKPSWPSYAKLVFGGEPFCSNYIDESDVELVMPDIDDRCSDMSINGNFETGTREGWGSSWFASQVLQEANSTNYYLRAFDKRLTRSNIYTYVDHSCMRKGERYRVSAKIRIQNNDVEKSCLSSGYPECPSLSFRLTEGDQNTPISFYSLGEPDSIIGNGTWASFSTEFVLNEDIPANAFQSLVMFRLPPKTYNSVLLDDFKMEHVITVTTQ